MREHFTKRKDGEFMGIISRVTSSGRYKPNWVWQKVNRSTSEPRKVEEIEEQQEEGQGKEEEGQGKEEEGESKPQKKKVIYVKRKTLKKSPSPPSPS